MSYDVTLVAQELVLRFPDLPKAGNGLVQPPSWRERLWTCPDDARLGVVEAAEALGRPKAFVYRHTGAGTIPHRKLEGEIVFVANELRAWLNEREEVVVARKPVPVNGRPPSARS